MAYCCIGRFRRTGGAFPFSRSGTRRKVVQRRAQSPFFPFKTARPPKPPLIAHPSRPAREIAQFVRAVLAYRCLAYRGFIWAYIGGICRGLAYRPHMQGLHTVHARIMHLLMHAHCAQHSAWCMLGYSAQLSHGIGMGHGHAIMHSARSKPGHATP